MTQHKLWRCHNSVGPEGAAAPPGLPLGITAERANNDNILHGSFAYLHTKWDPIGPPAGLNWAIFGHPAQSNHGPDYRRAATGLPTGLHRAAVGPQLGLTWAKFLTGPQIYEFVSLDIRPHAGRADL